MARPIKETPVLKGRDARRFADKIANPVRISKEEREKAEKLFEEIKKKCHFAI
jgi:organic hydroperoxide reductase OsmC/OhrA